MITNVYVIRVAINLLQIDFKYFVVTYCLINLVLKTDRSTQLDEETGVPECGLSVRYTPG